MRFHDGRELTAADVRYTYDWMRDPKNHSPNLGALAVVAAIETPDPQTVRFVLKEPFASFLQNLTLGIVPAHLGDAKEFVDAPVGSGPFRWGEWRPGERLVLLAFDGSWEGRPHLDRVVFRIVANETTRLLEARRGRIDLLWNNIPPYAVPFLREAPDLAVTTRPGITYQYLGFNLRDAILQDARVRRAIAHAVDRDRIVKALFLGLARPAATLLAPENWAHAGDVATYRHDPALARRLLDEAGFPVRPDGSRFALSYKTSTDRQGIEMADLVRRGPRRRRHPRRAPLLRVGDLLRRHQGRQLPALLAALGRDHRPGHAALHLPQRLASRPPAPTAAATPTPRWTACSTPAAARATRPRDAPNWSPHSG